MALECVQQLSCLEVPDDNLRVGLNWLIHIPCDNDLFIALLRDTNLSNPIQEVNAVGTDQACNAIVVAFWFQMMANAAIKYQQRIRAQSHTCHSSPIHSQPHLRLQ